MAAPVDRHMCVGIAPTAASGDCIANCGVQTLCRQVAVEISVQFAERCDIARSKAAVHYLDGQLAVSGGSTVADAVLVFQLLYQALRAHDVAGHAVAKEHEMAAARL